MENQIQQWFTYKGETYVLKKYIRDGKEYKYYAKATSPDYKLKN